MPEKLKKAEGLKSLLLRKKPSEIIKAYDFRDESCTVKERKIEIIIPLALTLHSLSLYPKEYLKKSDIAWIERAKNFLKNEGKAKLSYNYWVRKSSLNKKFPLPDDLDDTVFALSALLLHNKEIDERFFLKIINLETKPGGPYKTWYVPNEKKYSKWQDVDPVVNANLYYLASLYGIKLNSLEKYIFECLKRGKFHSKYYPNPLIFIFFLSKAVKQNHNKDLFAELKKVLSKYKFDKLGKMEKLLFILSQAYLGLDIKNLKEILSWRQVNGLFPPLPFCYDFVQIDGKTTYAGSSIITTALVLELLLLTSKFKQKTDISEFEKKVKRYSGKYKKLTQKETSLSGEFDSILPIPVSVALSLKNKLSVREEKLMSYLSLGIYFSWSGYSIIDAILDGQLSSGMSNNAKEIIELGWRHFEKLFGFKNFKNEIIQAFLDCDEVYEWESQRPEKISSYDYIEKRMQPFLISLKFVPVFLGLNTKIGKDIYKIFKAKMVIDQLNDDAHDWKEDFKAGRRSYVLSLLLKASTILKHKNKKDRNKVFWEKIMPKVISICEKEYDEARAALKKLKLKEDYPEKVIERSFAPVKKAKEEEKKVKELLQSL